MEQNCKMRNLGDGDVGFHCNSLFIFTNILKSPQWSVCMCLTVAYKIFLVKNQGTDFSFFYIPNVPLFFFWCQKHLLRLAGALTEEIQRSQLMGRIICPSAPDTIKKEKRRKWEEEIVIVTLLTFPSNYASQGLGHKENDFDAQPFALFCIHQKSSCSHHIPL